MKTYKVIYTESLFHVFYVEAESEEEAREKFDKMAYNGELDFSDGEVEDTKVASVEEVSE